MNSCFLGDTVLQVWGEEEEEEQQHQQQQQEQQGLETVSEMENGFSGNLGFFARSSSRTRFYEVRGEEQGKGHFLQACFLCKQPLGEGNDIYMYRGDTPFCSEECRQEQIEIDEAKEKSWSPTMAKKLAQRKEQQKSTNKNHNFHIRAGTVVAG